MGVLHARAFSDGFEVRFFSPMSAEGHQVDLFIPSDAEMKEGEGERGDSSCTVRFVGEDFVIKEGTTQHHGARTVYPPLCRFLLSLPSTSRIRRH